MKNKFKKLLCLATVIMIVLATFIVPVSAEEEYDADLLMQTSVLYIDFLESYYTTNLVQKGLYKSTFDHKTGAFSMEANTTDGTADYPFFFIANSTKASISSEYFGFEFSIADIYGFPDSVFTMNVEGKKATLLTIENHRLYYGTKDVNESGLLYFMDGSTFNIKILVNLMDKKVYYSINDQDFVFQSLADLLYDSVEAYDRYFFFHTTSKQSRKESVNFTVKSMKMYEIPNSLGSYMFSNNLYPSYFDAYADLLPGFLDFDSYTNGFEIGRGSGYDEGYSYGWDIGYDLGYDYGYSQGCGEGNEGSGSVDDGSFDEGFAQGYIEGKNEGKNEYYNELYEKGLESIDENEGTMIQGFLSGMWNGVQNFMQELLDGITFSGLSLRSIVSTLLAIVLAAFVIRMLKG